MDDEIKIIEGKWHGHANYQCGFPGCAYADLDQNNVRKHYIKEHIGAPMSEEEVSGDGAAEPEPEPVKKKGSRGSRSKEKGRGEVIKDGEDGTDEN